MNEFEGAAVIVDLVRSRQHADRALAQRQVIEALEVANRARPAIIPLRPTVGDEFQGMYATLRDALAATILVRLALPDDLDCRFGIGVGDSRDIDDNAGNPIRDGSAWWNARAAITETKTREDDREPWLRTWVSVERTHENLADAAITNAYLLCRDQLLATQSPNSRRALLGQLLGETQREIAEALGVTQPTVSATLGKGSASALSASTQLLEVAR
jgi:predicted XRE-type DNA-binding protein